MEGFEEAIEESTKRRDARIARLPVWARDEIKRLERDLVAANAKITATETGESNVHVIDYGVRQAGGLPSEIALPPYSEIRFDLGDGVQIEIQHERRWTGFGDDRQFEDTGRLNVTAHGYGLGKRLNVWPEVTNVLTIGVGE